MVALRADLAVDYSFAHGVKQERDRWLTAIRTRIVDINTTGVKTDVTDDPELFTTIEQAHAEALNQLLDAIAWDLGIPAYELRVGPVTRS